MSRKKPLLFVGERVTSSCKLVRLSAGALVSVTQSVVIRSEFCCNTKFVEGTSQDKKSLLLDDAKFTWGFGIEYEV